MATRGLPITNCAHSGENIQAGRAQVDIIRELHEDVIPTSVLCSCGHGTTRRQEGAMGNRG